MGNSMDQASAAAYCVNAGYSTAADAVIMVKMVNFFAVDGYQFDFSMDPGIVAAVTAVDGTYIAFAGCVATAMGEYSMDQTSAATYCEGAGYSSGLESATMGAIGSSGTVMGYSMAGGSVPPGYPIYCDDDGVDNDSNGTVDDEVCGATGPDSDLDGQPDGGNLLAVIVLNSQYSGVGAEVEVTISDFVVSGINPFTGGSVTLNACDADLDPFNGCFDIDTFSTPQHDCANIPAGSSTIDSCGDCGGGVGDSDGDGSCDTDDGCPDDANKTAAGICGCGTADTDTDTDGTADCNDGCPDDTNKIAAGI
jgi:hypothetical protein